MVSSLIILAIVMLIAILLGLAELFLFPGITVAGLGGLLFAGGGLYYAYGLGGMIGNVTLVCSVIMFVAGIVWFMRSRSLNKIALNTDVDSRLESSHDLGIREGDEGVSVSRLAPIGRAKFGALSVEAQSENGFIDENTPVIVTKVTGYNVVVRRKDIEY